LATPLRIGSGGGRLPGECRTEQREATPSRPVRIGVARDVAFQFYYAENLDLLREAGAELHFWSPLGDHELPDVDGLYFGGGYPELHARRRAGQHRARLSDRPARRARARGGLSRRPDAHELRPPALRLEPRAPARLREGMRRVGAVRAAALALGLLLAVSPPAEAYSARDMLGREVALAAPPARIVSLVPSVTEVLFALGAEA